jgi:hypothetical protein
LTNLIEEEPTADQDTIYHKWRAKIADDPKLEEAALIHLFDSCWSAEPQPL